MDGGSAMKFSRLLSVVFSTVLSALLLSALIACSIVDSKSDAVKPSAPKSFLQSSPQIQRFEISARNTPQAMAAPYVVLVSLDGFRYDYPQRHGAQQLIEMAKNGVAAKSLIPIFPSKTFPNHYSIVTGLYADEHGMVSNEFHDPAINKDFSLGGNNAMESQWWEQGEPLWVTAGKSGYLTASFFWVGSEALIKNRYPNWYVKYDQNVAHEDRINIVLSWLRLPENERPHFITLYFSDVDSAGHSFGPEAPEVGQAVQVIDRDLALLRQGLADLKLPVNLVVVSDHGMEKLDSAKQVFIDTLIDTSPFIVNGSGTMMKFYLKPGLPATKIDEAVAELKKHGGPLRVWKRSEMTKLHYSKNERSGDFIVEMDAPYLAVLKSKGGKVSGGNHGWDPQKFTNMHGIFYAEGPAFKKGYELPSFENVNIYPLLAHILGITQLPKISGDLAVTKSALVE